MNKILLKYDKIFIDTSTFLINMDNIFNSNQYINKFTNEKSDHHVQKQLFIEYNFKAFSQDCQKNCKR